ncbi:MAG: flagellar biosynthesis anti-sigma factor FlgM [Clostridiales bacterium]|jgi:anti-sigma28 factor (negative regulator of flagellin synthesis)|nr:flagellar biosynthesis anti-sigma factor FlgM [Clostridiales bacterium]
MKISRDNFNKVYGRIKVDATDPVYADKKIGKGTGTTNKAAATSLPKDAVQISEKAKEYNMGKNFVRSAISKAEESASPERLMRLKKEVAAGTYYVSSDKIANAILGNVDKDK